MQKQMSRMMPACLLCVALALSACAPILVADHPLENWSPDMHNRQSKQIAGNRSPELLVYVAFSGGGTRAAAFAYGVLQELAKTEVITEKGPHMLAKEIDMISSVSGGSFTSAYYGLYGDRIFEDFEQRFLRRNVQGALFGQLFNPVNWFRLMTPGYGRGDIADRYYNKNIFDGATFADLNRPEAPMIIINSTDLPEGARITFSDWMFNLICVDLDPFPVSRAVAASSGVPVLFNPITVKNHAGTCGYEPPDWLGEAAKDEDDAIRRLGARMYLNLMDAEKRPWLHLVDGGVSDNLGLRSIYSISKMIDDPKEALVELGHPTPRQILIITVDSHTAVTPHWAFKLDSPGIPEVIASMSSSQILQYTADTLTAVRYVFGHWAEQASTPEDPVLFNFVEVSFEKVKDEAEHDYLNHIGTSFHLKDEEIDRLISAGGQVLRESPDFKEFLETNRKRQ